MYEFAEEEQRVVKIRTRLTGRKTRITKMVKTIPPLKRNVYLKLQDIYSIKFGAEQYVSGLRNVGVSVRDLGKLDVKPVFRTRIEFYNGMAVFSESRCNIALYQEVCIESTLQGVYELYLLSRLFFLSFERVISNGKIYYSRKE